MQVIRYDLSILTNGLGGFTGTITPVVGGLIHQMCLSSGLTDGYGLVVSSPGLGLSVLTVASGGSSTTPYTWSPRQVIHDYNDGSEIVANSSGSTADVDIVGTPISIGNDDIQVVVTAGGAMSSAKLYIWIVCDPVDYLLLQAGGWCHASYPV